MLKPQNELDKFIWNKYIYLCIFFTYDIAAVSLEKSYLVRYISLDIGPRYYAAEIQLESSAEIAD